MQVEDQEKMRRFNEEWDRAHSTDDTKPPLDPRDLNKENSDGPSLLEQVQQTGMQINTGTYQPAAIPTTGDRCTQCGTLHPPLKPGDECPVAKEMAQKNASAAPQPVTPLTEGTTQGSMSPKIDNKPQVRPVNPPPPVQPQQPSHEMSPASARGTWDPVEPEPEPLAENNIPTEIHVNKYLKSWSELIMTHCKNHGVQNVKRLMRHLTVEVTDFLEHNKGR